MLPALWVAKTGLSAQDMNLTTISNNLANVSTTGFKRDRADFEDLLYQIRRQPGGQSSQDSELPTGLQLGTGVRIAGTQKIFTAGSLQTTEQPLDMVRRMRLLHQPGVLHEPDLASALARAQTLLPLVPAGAPPAA